jgi:hypothetical protein
MIRKIPKTVHMLAIVCFLALAGCGGKENAEPPDHFLRVLSVPDVPLAEGERISGLQVDMTCGRFRSVNRIPNDWSLTIDGPVSERSTLKAVANHGTSWLWSSSNLQGFATIMVCSTSYFDVALTVFTQTGDAEGKRVFRRDQLKLEMLSR